MRNDQGSQEYSEAPPVRRCAHCAGVLLEQRKGAKYCGRRCKELARERRKRRSDRLARLRQNHPLADAALTETDPGEDLREVSDYHDLISLDDEPGEYESSTFFSDAMRVEQALDKLRERYQEMARPLLAVQARNPGVRLPALVKLELAYEQEMTAILRAHERVTALERAARRQPEVQVRAAERQMEEAALNAFARDLPGGSRRYHVNEFHGRDTTHIAIW